MEYLEAVNVMRSERWQHLLAGGEPPPRAGRNLSQELNWIQVQATRGDVDALPRHFYLVWFALIQEMRRRADLAERTLIRDLRGRGKTWNEIAETLAGQVGTRQAVQQRWARLQERATGETEGDDERAR